MKYKAIFCFVLGFALLQVDVQASNSLEVIDPYLEMRSGPGRGYPVFYVIEEGEQIDMLVRQPGWYEVRAANGKQGWVAESQIARTMQNSGEPADLPTVSYGDYLKRGWQVGFSSGQFNGGELDADIIKANLGYRPLSWVVVEIETAKFFGPNQFGDYSSFNLVLEPWSKNRWSPAVLLGSGEIDIRSQPEIERAHDEGDFTHYGFRINYYIGRNFLVNLEYKHFDSDLKSALESELPAAETINEELEAWYIGFNTFF